MITEFIKMMILLPPPIDTFIPSTKGDWIEVGSVTVAAGGCSAVEMTANVPLQAYMVGIEVPGQTEYFASGYLTAIITDNDNNVDYIGYYRGYGENKGAKTNIKVYSFICKGQQVLTSFLWNSAYQNAVSFLRNTGMYDPIHITSPGYLKIQNIKTVKLKNDHSGWREGTIIRIIGLPYNEEG